MNREVKGAELPSIQSVVQRLSINTQLTIMTPVIKRRIFTNSKFYLKDQQVKFSIVWEKKNMILPGKVFQEIMPAKFA